MWQGNVREENVERFKARFEDHDLPILRAQKGCIGAFLSRDYYGKEESFVIMSLWKDLDSLIAFTGSNWEKPVPGNSEETLVEVTSSVKHYTIRAFEGS